VSWGTEDHKHNAYDVYGVADEHHRHYDLEPEIAGLREDRPGWERGCPYARSGR
jgi:hypothetical protein